MKGTDKIEKIWWQMKQRRKEMRFNKKGKNKSRKKENFIRFPGEKISTEKLK